MINQAFLTYFCINRFPTSVLSDKKYCNVTTPINQLGTVKNP